VTVIDVCVFDAVGSMVQVRRVRTLALVQDDSKAALGRTVGGGAAKQLALLPMLAATKTE